MARVSPVSGGVPPRLGRSSWEAPMFALTADQDWAPAWASSQLLATVGGLGVPLHVFRTNPCPVLDAAFARGENKPGVASQFPPGLEPRSHAGRGGGLLPFAFPVVTHREGTLLHGALHGVGRAGRRGDRGGLPASTFFQGDLVPLLHASGIWRLPVSRGRHLLRILFRHPRSREHRDHALSLPGLSSSTSIRPSSPRTCRRPTTTRPSRAAGSHPAPIIGRWSIRVATWTVLGADPRRAAHGVAFTSFRDARRPPAGTTEPAGRGYALISSACVVSGKCTRRSTRPTRNSSTAFLTPTNGSSLRGQTRLLAAVVVEEHHAARRKPAVKEPAALHRGLVQTAS